MLAALDVGHGRPGNALVRRLRFPALEQRLQLLDKRGLGGIVSEIAGQDQGASLAAELLGVELLDLVERHVFHAGNGFLDRRLVTDVVLRIRIERAPQGGDGQRTSARSWIASVAVRFSFFSTSNSSAGKLGLRSTSLSSATASGKFFFFASRVKRTTPVSLVALRRAPSLSKRVLKLLAGVLVGAAGHERAEEIGGGSQAGKRFFVAVAQGQLQDGRFAAGLLRQQRDLRPFLRHNPLGPLFDVFRRRIECLAGGNGLRSLVTLTRSATEGVAGMSARTSWSALVGMNMPTVRLLAFRYFWATRFTSSAVTLATRSRCRKNSRQSPAAPIRSV